MLLAHVRRDLHKSDPCPHASRGSAGLRTIPPLAFVSTKLNWMYCGWRRSLGCWRHRLEVKGVRRLPHDGNTEETPTTWTGGEEAWDFLTTERRANDGLLYGEYMGSMENIRLYKCVLTHIIHKLSKKFCEKHNFTKSIMAEHIGWAFKVGSTWKGEDRDTWEDLGRLTD